MGRSPHISVKRALHLKLYHELNVSVLKVYVENMSTAYVYDEKILRLYHELNISILTIYVRNMSTPYVYHEKISR